MKPTALTIYGFAKPDGGVNPGRDPWWRLYQIVRRLGLLIPTVQMTYLNSALAWRPTTQTEWKKGEVANYSYFEELGNADENGDRDGWDWTGGGATWEVECPPRLNETLYGWADPIEGGALRSICPRDNDNVPYNPVTGELDWRACDVKPREGVAINLWPPGSRPDSRQNANGQFDKMNDYYWFEVYLWLTRHPFILLATEWIWHIYYTNPNPNPILGAPIGQCFIDYAAKEIKKVGSMGEPEKTPFLVLGDELDPDSGIVKPGHDIEWPRVVR